MVSNSTPRESFPTIHVDGDPDARYQAHRESTGDPDSPWVARITILPMVTGWSVGTYVGRFDTREAAIRALRVAHDRGLCIRCAPRLRYRGFGRGRGLTGNGYVSPLPVEVTEEFLGRTSASISVSVEGWVVIGHCDPDERRWLETRLGALAKTVEHLEVFSRYEIVGGVRAYVDGSVLTAGDR